MRRAGTIVAIGVLAMLASTEPGYAQSGGDGGNSAVAVDLRTQLSKGLLARRDVEFEFVDRVVAAVVEERIPRKVVDSTFAYARKKPFHKFQYFQRAMEIQAKRLGVEL